MGNIFDDMRNICSGKHCIPIVIVNEQQQVTVCKSIILGGNNHQGQNLLARLIEEIKKFQSEMQQLHLDVIIEQEKFIKIIHIDTSDFGITDASQPGFGQAIRELLEEHVHQQEDMKAIHISNIIGGGSYLGVAIADKEKFADYQRLHKNL